MTNIQQRYRAHQQEGWPGQLARPNEPHYYHTGILHIPANGRKPRPGDALVYDSSQDSFKLPTSDAESAKVCGILAYDQGTVQKSLASAPTGVNSEAFVEYENDAVVKVGVMGTFFVMAGAAMEYDQLVEWQRDDYLWNPVSDLALALTGNQTSTTINTGVNALLAAMRRCPIVCVSREPVPANQLAEVRINGRAF
ncbi:MAG: hypothetical protein OXH56_00270 [Gemmatimonadetes bacterium]|nr:hypothetical protein [Gemmatimonadota bacterium]